MYHYAILWHPWSFYDPEFRQPPAFVFCDVWKPVLVPTLGIMQRLGSQGIIFICYKQPSWECSCLIRGKQWSFLLPGRLSLFSHLDSLSKDQINKLELNKEIALNPGSYGIWNSFQQGILYTLISTQRSAKWNWSNEFPGICNPRVLIGPLCLSSSAIAALKSHPFTWMSWHLHKTKEGTSSYNYPELATLSADPGEQVTKDTLATQ